MESKVSDKNELLKTLLNKRIRHLSELNKEEFFYTSDWPVFYSEYKHTFIIYPLKNAFTNGKITFRATTLNIGEMLFIYSDEIHIAYGFVLNNGLNLCKNRYYFQASQKKLDLDFLKSNRTKPYVVLSNKIMTVYTYGEDILLAAKKVLLYPLVTPA
jgi:hypothetical protein